VDSGSAATQKCEPKLGGCPTTKYVLIKLSLVGAGHARDEEEEAKTMHYNSNIASMARSYGGIVTNLTENNIA
jgi:hypothetical protein